MAHARSEARTEVLPSAGNARWGDFGVRLASAAVLAPVVLLALWRGGWAWDGVIGLALAGLGWEWARLAGRPAARVWLAAGLLLAMGVTLAVGWAAGLLALAVVAVTLGWRFGWFLGIGALYAGIGGLALLLLRLRPGTGFDATLFLVAVIWATDIGAYLVGRVVGGRRMAPKISPGKTWSGAVGGLLLAAAAGVILAGMNGVALADAVALSVFAQSGDLLESAIKRKLGVKDSGRTIPGHGGLFDRLDGFLTAAPLALILAMASA